jgi:hypothetical protein
MTNIVNLPCVTRLDLPAERVIEALKDAGLKDLAVVGWDEAGDFYFASNLADGGDVLWLLELAKRKLMEAAG